MEGVVVTKLPIGLLIGYFVFYLVTHIAIGLYVKYNKKELENAPKNKTLIKREKSLNIIFNWYPFFYLFVIIIMLMN